MPEPPPRPCPNGIDCHDGPCARWLMVDCDCAGIEPHFVGVALLAGAPIGNICKACGESCDIGTRRASTLPHQHPDILAMIDRGDFDA